MDTSPIAMTAHSASVRASAESRWLGLRMMISRQRVNDPQHERGCDAPENRRFDISRIPGSEDKVVRQRVRRARRQNAGRERIGDSRAQQRVLSNLEEDVHRTPRSAGAVAPWRRPREKRRSEQGERKGVREAGQPLPEHTKQRCGRVNRDGRTLHAARGVPIRRVDEDASQQHKQGG